MAGELSWLKHQAMRPGRPLRCDHRQSAALSFSGYCCIGALAAAAGCVAAVSPVAFAALLLASLLLVPLVATRPSVKLAPVAILVISPSVVLPDLDVADLNGDSLQKFAVLGGILAIIASYGLRRTSHGLWAAGLLAFALVVSILDLGGEILSGTGTATRAFFGFALPWLVLFIKWPPEAFEDVLAFLSRLPPLSIMAGLLLEIVGLSDVGATDVDGIPRLQGASIAPHLAMLCFVAIIAGLTLAAASPRRSQHAVLTINIVILLGTVTRGAIVASLFVIIVFAIRTLSARTSLGQFARRAGKFVGLVSFCALVVTLPEIISRSTGNSYEGTLNTSGRDAAWDFYLGLALESPVTGKGLGFSSVANREFQPAGVQSAFEAPHNEYIHVLLDMGVILGVGYALIIAGLFLHVSRRIERPLRPLVLSVACALAVYSAVDNTFSTPQLTVTLMLYISVLAIPNRESVADSRGSTLIGDLRG